MRLILEHSLKDGHADQVKPQKGWTALRRQRAAHHANDVFMLHAVLSSPVECYYEVAYRHQSDSCATTRDVFGSELPREHRDQRRCGKCDRCLHPALGELMNKPRLELVPVEAMRQAGRLSDRVALLRACVVATALSLTIAQGGRDAHATLTAVSSDAALKKGAKKKKKTRLESEAAAVEDNGEAKEKATVANDPFDGRTATVLASKSWLATFDGLLANYTELRDTHRSLVAEFSSTRLFDVFGSMAVDGFFWGPSPDTLLCCELKEITRQFVVKSMGLDATCTAFLSNFKHTVPAFRWLPGRYGEPPKSPDRVELLVKLRNRATWPEFARAAKSTTSSAKLKRRDTERLSGLNEWVKMQAVSWWRRGDHDNVSHACLSGTIWKR